jgi:hypothetical protein
MAVGDEPHGLEAFALPLNGPPAPRAPVGGEGALALLVRRLEVLPLGVVRGDLDAIELVGGVPPAGIVLHI